jgi:tRNA-splicing endonuclease subunit Sen34
MTLAQQIGMMAPSAAPYTVEEPFPISRVADRYLLFSIDIISHCRRNHNICGMLVGTIPNLSQQNVFLGIPLELMPEEARVLVERGAAYIVDDAEVHKEAFGEMSREDRLKWLEEMDRRGAEVTRGTEEMKEMRKDKALKGKGLRKEVLEKSEESVAESIATDETLRDDVSDTTSSGLGFIMKGSGFLESAPVLVASSPSSSSGSNLSSNSSPSASGLGFIMKGSSFVDVSPMQIDQSTDDISLFDSAPDVPSPPVLNDTPPALNDAATKGPTTQKHFVTPTTSYPPLPNPAQDSKPELPAVPKSYPLFRYLHSLNYYHMPGLRFGCHYNAYPGDPLRYHSHFAATGLGWDDEFELLDIVGGGRLATGTKKAYMIGGEDSDVVKAKEKAKEGAGLFSDDTVEDERREVRAFSIEWAAL